MSTRLFITLTLALAALAALRPLPSRGASPDTGGDTAAEAPLIVDDYPLLDHRLRSTGLVELNVGGDWTPTDGGVLDLISARSVISAVSTRFDAPTGYQQRVRFMADGASTWGPWSAWTTSRVVHSAAVPLPGETNEEQFEAEVRRSAGSPTIANGGYIRIKKLNSGG